MSIEQARRWADKGSMESMSRRLKETEVWVAEVEEQIIGWIAVRDDYLDALYVDPKHARRGIGSHLLQMVELELRARGVRAIRTDASWNSENFYIRQGYEPLGPRPADDARPLRKTLST
jgi:putative acetyltransferase